MNHHQNALEALAQLSAVAGLIDTAECKDEGLYNRLQSALAVANASLDDAMKAIAAAPQVVADESKAVSWLCTDLDGHGDVGFTKEIAKQRAGYSCDHFIPLFDNAAPVQAQEQVAGKPCPYCGSTDGEHDKAYPHPRAPVQPVAVPDEPSAEDYSDMLRDFFFRYAAGGYNDDGGLVPLAKAKDKLQWVIDEEGKRAAPAAQGDAQGSTDDDYKEGDPGWRPACCDGGGLDSSCCDSGEGCAADCERAAIAAKAAS